MGPPRGWRADSGACFPRREYTEDGQVKTERKYSYSESRAPPCSLQPVSFLSQHQAPGVLVLGALLPRLSSKAPGAAPLARGWSQA